MVRQASHIYFQSLIGFIIWQNFLYSCICLKVTGEKVKGRMVREATWLCGAMPRSDSCWCVSGGGEKLISSHDGGPGIHHHSQL
jgi:hypothetical protein